MKISLAVSTYQAGKVILVRADSDSLNTHFHAFSKPMGIAADGARLTGGGTNTVWYYRNVSDAAHRLWVLESGQGSLAVADIQAGTGTISQAAPCGRITLR